MNFSAISERSLLGAVLRFPLRWIPPETTVPILQGRLKGKKWIVGSGDHGCWLGSYEYRKRLVFEGRVAPGSIVFDIGANVGFYTLLASVLVGPHGRVFAFEPLVCNLRYLTRHLELNQAANVTVFDVAVTDRRGTVPFDPGPNASMAHLAGEGALSVPTVSLDELVASGEVPAPDHIKIDVESAEFLVLCGARSLLASSHPTLYLATDTGRLHQQCCELLGSLGYHLEPVDAADLAHSQEILAYYKDW